MEPRFELDDGLTLFASGRRGRRSYWIDYAAPIDAAVSNAWSQMAKGTALRLSDPAFSDGIENVLVDYKKRAAALTAAFRKLLLNREGYVPQVIVGTRKGEHGLEYVLLLRYKRGIRRAT